MAVVRTIIALLVGLSCLSAADARHRRPIIVPSVPITPPIVTPQASPGVNTRGTNMPGTPNTSRPGTIGTGASPSGLPGDSPTSPGFPNAVGQWQR
jgi:hypothetical protein